ncbi:hypothetical protein, partial [Pseudomonas kitaguniensis]|uniref:hypothetical protein n=1 Tax=Pseudomonas kitaguniensis TaxID=2607908 RepID=UPI003D01C892
MNRATIGAMNGVIRDKAGRTTAAGSVVMGNGTKVIAHLSRRVEMLAVARTTKIVIAFSA